MTFLENIGLSGDFLPCDNNLPYVNRNFFIIDSILQMKAIDFVESLPLNPNNGDVYIIENSYYTYGPSESVIAAFNGTSWVYIIPKEGFRSYVESEGYFYWFDGSQWIADPKNVVETDGSSVDKSIARFDGTNGKWLTDSGVILEDDNSIHGATSIYTDNLIAEKTYTNIIGGDNSLIVESPANNINVVTVFGTILTPIAEIQSIGLPYNEGRSFIFSIENKSGSTTLIKNNASIVTGIGRDFEFKTGTSLIVIYSSETDTFNIVSGGGTGGRGRFSKVQLVNSNVTLADDVDLVIADVSGGSVEIKLPPISELGQCVLIKRGMDSTGNRVDVVPNAGNNIETEILEILPYPGDYMEFTSITSTQWGKTT